MTADELREQTAAWRRAEQHEKVLRADRDIMIGRAIAAGIPQRTIAEAVGVTAGRVGQIASKGTA